jgi:hypothetical protein
MKSAEYWENLRTTFKELTELEVYGADIEDPPALANLVDKAHSEEPDKASYDFLERALGAVICCCDPTTRRELRVRLGKYKKERFAARTESLCLLLAQNDPSLGWHEVHVHNQLPRK